MYCEFSIRPYTKKELALLYFPGSNPRTAVNHLGLIQAVEERIDKSIPIVNCHKCLSFWATLAYCVATSTTAGLFSASGGSAAAQQAPPQPAQQSHRPCPQDCNRCSISQQIFCSTKMLFDLSRSHQEARQRIAAMEAAIAEIQSQLQPKDTDTPLSTPFIEAS